MNRVVKKILALCLVSLMVLAVPFTSGALSGAGSYEPAESNIAVKYWVTANATSGTAALATDGKTDTAWIPAALPATLTLDLGGAYDAVRKVETVFADNTKVYKYVIEGSKNGTTWTALADRSANTKRGGVYSDIFSLEGLKAVRIRLLSGAAGISEFRVINYFRKNMDNGSDIGGLQTGTYYYNANNNPPMPGIRGGVGNAASISTGNNFYGLTKDLGWDTIRMRIWNEPRSEGDWRTQADPTTTLQTLPAANMNGGSSPNATRTHAQYVVGAGQNLAIDFHYADSWSDPQNQPKPYAWAELPFNELVTKTHDFTYDMIKSLIDQGTTPTVVALGNEITNGMMWGSEYLEVNPYAHFHDYYERFIRANNPDGTPADPEGTPNELKGKTLNPAATPGGGIKWIKYEEAHGDKTSAAYQAFLGSMDNLAALVDAGNRAIHELNVEYASTPGFVPIKTEMHFAFNVFEQPASGKVAMDPDEVFEKVQTLVGGLATRLQAKDGMTDRIGVSYYPDWHGTYEQVQRNIVELSKMLPGVQFNIAECSPKSSGTETDWMTNPNHIPQGSPEGTRFVCNAQTQGDDGIEIMKVINDVPNNVGQGVWPWNGQSVYGTGGTLRVGFLAFHDSFAKNILESNVGLTTGKGEYPSLPRTLKSMDVATGVITDVPVVWDAVSAGAYQNLGDTFTIQGVAAPTVPAAGKGKAMTKVTATVTVVQPDLVVTPATGTEVTVPIKVKNCSQFAGMTAKIAYDDAYLTLEGVSAAKGYSFDYKNNAFVVITPNGAGVDGDVVVGFAIFRVKADLLDDVTTYVTFPKESINAKNADGITTDVSIGTIEVTIVGIPPEIGNVNLDGKVDVADAILLMQYLAGSVELTPRQLKAADANRDGKVNVGDVTIIMQMCLPA